MFGKIYTLDLIQTKNGKLTDGICDIENSLTESHLLQIYIYIFSYIGMHIKCKGAHTQSV